MTENGALFATTLGAEKASCNAAGAAPATLARRSSIRPLHAFAFRPLPLSRRDKLGRPVRAARCKRPCKLAPAAAISSARNEHITRANESQKLQLQMHERKLSTTSHSIAPLPGTTARARARCGEGSAGALQGRASCLGAQSCPYATRPQHSWSGLTSFSSSSTSSATSVADRRGAPSAEKSANRPRPGHKRLPEGRGGGLTLPP